MDDYLSGTDRTFTVPRRHGQGVRRPLPGHGQPRRLRPAHPDAGGLVEVRLGFTTGEGGVPLVDPQPTLSVFLMSGDADGDQGPWTVVRATTSQIVVTEPSALDRVTSPVAVRGAAATYEGNVLVQVREDGMLDGANLGFGPVTGRGDGVLGDFSGDIAFTAPSTPAGAIVFSERSALDGHTVRATVVRVAF